MTKNHAEPPSAEALEQEARFQVEVKYFWGGIASSFALLWALYGGLQSHQEVAYWEALEHEPATTYAFLEQEARSLNKAPLPIGQSMAALAREPREKFAQLRALPSEAPPVLGWAHASDVAERSRAVQTWQQNHAAGSGAPGVRHE